MSIHNLSTIIRRLTLCLLPLAAGIGGALVLLLLASRPARPAYAATLTFPGCASTIQGCIDNASPGDTILISAGDYTESLTLSKAVSLTGALSSTTILNALPMTRVLTIEGAAVDSSVVISGLTFTGGDVTGTQSCPDSCGGGIMITGTAQPLLENIILTHNSAYNGGGLFNIGITTLTSSAITSNTATYEGGGIYSNGSLAIASNTISNNTASFGGGIYSNGTLAIASNTISSNTATFGGGGVVNSGTLTITSSTITSNTTGGDGGGVANLYGTQTINSSAITGNTAINGDGGGVWNYNGTLTITSSAISGNTATSSAGGGVFNGGTLTITSSTISNNTAFNGAGSGVLNSGTLTITSSTISNNTAGDGGGGVLNSGTLTITSSTISNNTAGDGGGVYNYNGTLTITRSTISNNTASFGGGVLNSGTLTITSSTISNNTAFYGGGLWTFAGNGRIVNDLFAANQASGHGDALYLDSTGNVAILYDTIASPTVGSGTAIFVAAGTVGITDTIIASYTTGISQAAGSVFQDYNLFFGNGTNTTGTVSGGAHSLTGDPVFVNPTRGDYHLGSGSAAIDAGTDAGVTTDFEGDPRPLGAGFDIGFDEWTGNAISDVGVTKYTSASLVAPGQLLTYTLVYSNAGPYIATGVYLTDLVPANLTAITYTSSGAAFTPLGLSPYSWQVAYLALGSGGIITVTGMVSGGLHGSVFTNTTTITAAFTDTNPANNTSAVSVTVANVPPVAADDAYTLPANSTLTVTAPGVLVNDTDANGDPLTAALAADPLTGTLNLHADGSFTYTPPVGFMDVVTFTYRANDGLADSNIATVTLTVGPPIANVGLVKSASASLVAPGQALTYTLVFSNAGPSLAAGVRVTDIVPANLFAITYTSSGAALTPVGLSPHVWQVSNLAPGAGGVIIVTGVLSGGLHGTVFTNTATITSPYLDTNPANNTSAVSVTVANVPPVAADDIYTVTGNTTLTVTAPGVLANDTDANNDPLTAVLVAGPPTGTLDLHAEGSFAYTPPHGFVGLVTFTYRAKDGLADSNTATVTITVTTALYKLYLPVELKP